jgi:hypothetical protein
VIVRGLAHVHSRRSYDGCHDLADIARHAQRARLDFVLMSEHTRTLTDGALAELAAECETLTRAFGVVLVPGIECEAMPDYVHVLGYGVRTLVRGGRVGDIASAIRAAGGLAVLAHPVHREAWRHVGREELAALQGWEVWNGKADGGWYPSTEAIERLAELGREGASPAPMAGADLHRLEADPGIVLEVTCRHREAADILAALAARAYRVTGRAFAFAAGEPLRPPPRTARRLAADAVLGTRWRAHRLHGWLARHGLGPPKPVARVARRLLR